MLAPAVRLRPAGDQGPRPPVRIEPVTRAGTPRKIAGGWKLPLRYTRDGSGVLTYVVDGRTLLFRSARAVVGGQVLDEMIRPLTKMPVLPQPTPRC